jgi:AGZA family xanthine/uracil permease-like MFS transporter
LATTVDSAPPRSAAYKWATPGDVNAFFGLMLDNVGGMILMSGLLVGVFGFPANFVLTQMIPGTAIGVLVGDLIFTGMAFALARRSGRTDVTAMPLGLDTPSTFGSVFLILGPAFLSAKARGLSPDAAAQHAWFVGIAILLASGIFKLACATVSSSIRRHVPRAGLLGSLASIALVIISFLPLLDIAAAPVAGFSALAIILATLTARWKLPGRVPGALGALIVGCAALMIVNLVHFALNKAGLGPLPVAWTEGQRPALSLRAVVPIPIAEWWRWALQYGGEAASYLPVAAPMALATVVGGIDCAESAAAAGDDYPTGPIIAVEGLATLVAGVFGGVIQTTPYIGHPAYKAMGARAAYTLATALFVGSAGILGYFDWIFFLVPKVVVFPILIFVGLEIAAQSFLATPRQHYPALAFACVPALAYLALIPINQIVSDSGKSFAQFGAPVQHLLQTITMLSGGFIITSLLWATGLARVIDGRIRGAAATFLLAGVLALFGVIHSGLPSNPIVPPWQAIHQLKAEQRFAASAAQTPYHWAAAYATMAFLLLVLGKTGTPPAAAEACVHGADDNGARGRVDA